MKSILLLTSALLTLLITTSFGLPPTGPVVKVVPRSAQVVDAQNYIDANRLLGFVSNFGNLFYDADQIFGKSDGLYYPYSGIDNILSHGNDSSVIFSAGLWIGGKVSGQVRIAAAEYSTEFVPGKMINGTFDPNAGNPAYRVYKIYADSLQSNPNTDYLQWPVSQGAPIDQYGQPLALGTQTLFAIYNDANPAQHQSDVGATQPLGIEVRQTVWSQRSTGAASTTINVRYDLYNKGTNQITDCYLALWSDPDIGQFDNDLVGCDTTAGVYYCYNSGIDDVFGVNAPAAGLRIIQGPVVPSPESTATFFGVTLLNRRNLQPTAFVKFINGTDPWEAPQTYNYLRGLYADGAPYTYNGTQTRFFNSGDPVAFTGDLDVSPADRRMLVSIGPFNFNPGDSQQLIVKWGVARGSSPINSVRVLKDYVLLKPPAPPKCCVGTTGNVNMTGIIDLSDLSMLVSYLTGVIQALPCPEGANVNRVGIVDLSDLSWLIAYLTVPLPPILPNCP